MTTYIVHFGYHRLASLDREQAIKIWAYTVLHYPGAYLETIDRILFRRIK